MRTFVMLLVGLGAGFLISSLIWGGSSGEEHRDAQVSVPSGDQAAAKAAPEAVDPGPGYLVSRERPDARVVRDRAIQLAMLEAGTEARPHSVEPADEPVGLPEQPPSLDQRFSESAILEALAAAFAEIGLEGRVIGADCSEYPCAVMASFQVEEAMDSEHLPNLLNSEALSMYREDAKNVAAISVPIDTTDRQGPARQYFAASFHPAGDAATHEALGERFRERFEGLAEKMVAEGSSRSGARP